MATNSKLFTGLALPISPSASLQQASPSSFNCVCIAKKSMTTPFLNPGSGTLKYKNARVAASYQSRGGRHRQLLVRANLFDRFSRAVKSFLDDVSSFLEDPGAFSEELGIDTDTDIGMDASMLFLHRQLEQVYALQKYYETEYKAAQKISEQWYQNARVLLEKGEEDLACEALTRWKSFGDDAKKLKQRLEDERGFGYTFLSFAKPIKGDIQRAVAKERRQAARTATKVSEVSGNGNTNRFFSAIENFEAKVMKLAAEPLTVTGKLRADELDKKYALKSAPFDDCTIATFKKELAAADATAEEENRIPRWFTLHYFAVEREMKKLRREIEEEK